MAYGLLNTYKGLRLVEWRSPLECWDHITSDALASGLGNYKVEKEKVDFDINHIIEFIIQNPSSLGLGYGPGRDILNELKKEENYNRLPEYYQETIDYQLKAWNY